MPELINLTPHPIRIYSDNTPDQIDDLNDGLIDTLPPSGTVARLAEIDLGQHRVLDVETYTHGVASIPVEWVEYGQVHGLPEQRDDVFLIVPLLIALGVNVKGDRPDLLVPYQQVRNAEGTVVGCRLLARPC